MADFKSLEENIKENPDARQSAATLVNAVADELDKLTHDPVAIKQMATDLRGSADSLASAVVANTSPSDTGSPSPGTEKGPFGSGTVPEETSSSVTPSRPMSGATKNPSGPPVEHGRGHGKK